MRRSKRDVVNKRILGGNSWWKNGGTIDNIIGTRRTRTSERRQLGLRRRNRNRTRNTTSRNQSTILATRGHYERSAGLARYIGIRTKVTPLGPRSHRKTNQILASAPIATVTKGTARLQKQKQEVKYKG